MHCPKNFLLTGSCTTLSSTDLHLVALGIPLAQLCRTIVERLTSRLTNTIINSLILPSLTRKVYFTPSDSRLNVRKRIEQFNQGRDPQLLQRKYQAMTVSAFVFLRGSCHLFWQDWSHVPVLDAAPAVWACGDLHLENFGVYRGVDRQLHFDINDFDDSCFAPCSWDLTRLITSLLVAADDLKLSKSSALAIASAGLKTYRETL